MNVTAIIHDGDKVGWDAYVNAFPGASNYHRFSWKRVIEKSFGHKGFYLAARDAHGVICGVLPLVHMKSTLFGNFLVSLPFFNYGGLLCDNGTAEQALIAAAERIRGECGADFVELRHRENSIEGLPARTHKVTMILDLESEEDVQWKRFDAKVRNQVRKAEKSGLRAVAGHLDLLNGFYDVFCRNMRDLGTPVYCKEFFRNVLEIFPETSRIISVLKNGKTVASAILIWFRGTLEVPWASSVRDYREMCPNNLLYWESIRFAIRNGSLRFDFGRSTLDEGTYRFKKQWGAQPVPLHWQYLMKDGNELPELNPANPKYRMAVRMWQLLPVALTRMLGPQIVRSIP
jgi:FemAB-related protein (PEP-CTERM system-associated)